MTTHPLITRLGGHSAKNAHRAGAANTQPTGETSMNTPPRPLALTAEVVLFTIDAPDERSVLLIQRLWPPFEGCWALPGGFLYPDETFLTAAHRELTDQTGQTMPHLEMVNVYDDPDRDPRARVVSVAFVGIGRGLPPPTTDEDATATYWVPLTDALADAAGFAFDHHTILTDALRMQGWLP